MIQKSKKAEAGAPYGESAKQPIGEPMGDGADLADGDAGDGIFRFLNCERYNNSIWIFMRYAILSLLVSSILFAEPPHRFDIAPDVYYRDYSEQGLPFPAKSDEYGFLYGFQAAYNYIKPCSPYFGAELRMASGTTVYDGSLMNFITNEITPYMDHTYNEIIDGEVRAGYTYQPTSQLLAIPFMGLGYHFWHRGVVAGNPYGYDEDYSWLYFSCGVRTEYSLNDQWRLGANLKLMQPLNGKMVASDMTDMTFHLGNETQFELELPLSYRLECPRQYLNYLRLVPYYQNQNIGRSDSHYAVVQGELIQFTEPASKTHVFGVRLEFVKNF